ncbi:MAG: hypothetical protein V2A54_05790 [Bacteroidota bacterium]
MFRPILFIIILAALIAYKPVEAQEGGQYFTLGYSVEEFQTLGPYNKVIDDFNEQKILEKADVISKLEAPGFLKGIALGVKGNQKFLSWGGDLHFHKYKDIAKGYDTLDNYYYKKIQVSHNGFGMFLTLNLIPGKNFRMGPGVALNIEQYYNKTKNTDNWTYNPRLSTDIFLLSSTFRFPISIGGPKFNLDIIPYYFFPFWNVNFQNFNHDINMGYEKAYSKEEMAFSPANTGVLVNLCFSLKK